VEEFYLSSEDLSELIKEHKRCKKLKDADRIKAVIRQRRGQYQ